MCMTYYIATKTEMPIIPYDEKNRSFNTDKITDEENSLHTVFSLPYIKMFGSDQGCGCGFRHAIIDENKKWFDVIDPPNEFDNSNHINLVDFISKNNMKENKVEILSCWNGDFNEPIEHRQTIKLSDILQLDFHFKERGLYTVDLKNYR